MHRDGMVDMDRLGLEESESRFAAFVESLKDVIGHRDRIGPFRDYCAGLLAGCERKSVEPLAAITAPGRVSRSINRFCISWARRRGPIRLFCARFGR